MHGSHSNPEISALIGITWFLAMNFLSLPGILEVVFGYQVFHYPDIPTAGTIFIIAAFYLMLYYHLTSRNRYITIYEQFAGESDRSRRTGNLIVGLYMVGSVVALLGPWIILSQSSVAQK